jgi:hypothetical protein
MTSSTPSLSTTTYPSRSTSKSRTMTMNSRRMRSMPSARRSTRRSPRGPAGIRMKRMTHRFLKMSPPGCHRHLYNFRIYAHFHLAGLIKTDRVSVGTISKPNSCVKLTLVNLQCMGIFLIDMKIYLRLEEEGLHYQR